MKIFFYELSKIFGNIKLLAFIIAVIMINIAFLVYNEYNGDFSPGEYNEIWENLSEMSQSERGEFIQEKSHIMNDLLFDYEGVMEVSFDYTGEWYKEEALINYVKGEVDQCLTYGDYLSSIDESADIMAEMPIFADKESFDYKNIMKTKDDFGHLERKALDPQPSKGILTAVRFGFTDVLAFILILFFLVVLISREKELEQIELFRTSEKGGMALACSKLSAVFFSDIIAIVALYGGSMLSGYLLYGFGDLNRDIQSVYGFFGSNLDITARQFLVYFLLLKLLSCFAFSALGFFLFTLMSGGIFNIAAMTAVTAAEGALYFFVEPSSIFALFRQINIFSAADSGSLLGKYLNINLFGVPIFSLPVSMAVTVVSAVAFSALGVAVFCIRRQAAKRRLKVAVPFGKHTRLLPHEMYKTFVGGKALIIIGGLLIFTILTYNPVKISYGGISDYIYISYVNQLQGEVTEEKLEFIESELEEAYKDTTESGRYRTEALERLKAHALYLREKDGLLFNDKGYDLLTGGNKQSDRYSACFMAVLVTIIAGYIYSEEYKTGAFRILRATQNGRGKTFLYKLLSAALAGFLIMAIINGTEFYNTLSAYGTKYIFAPAHSVEKLEAVGAMPIFWYLVLLELGRFAALVLQSAVIFFVSSKVKSYSLTVIGGIAGFAVPPIIAAAGFGFMDYFLLNPFLIGNMFF